MVVAKWSSSLSSTPTIGVRIPLKPILFYEKMFEKSENKQKEAGDGPFFQKNV